MFTKFPNLNTYPHLQCRLEHYFNLKIGKYYLACPYWMNKNHPKDGGSKVRGPFDGKGTPDEIESAVRKAANQAELNLNEVQPNTIINFMKQKKIGIDCSGYAYQLLNALDLDKGGSGLEGKLTTTPTNHPKDKTRDDRFQINANYLTQNPNSIKLNHIDEIEIGDLIRIDKGKHILFIIEKNQNYLIYTHSNKDFGVHNAQINFINRTKSLSSQEWLEKTQKGEFFKNKFFNESNGDGIYRLKVWL